MRNKNNPLSKSRTTTNLMMLPMLLLTLSRTIHNFFAPCTSQQLSTHCSFLCLTRETTFYPFQIPPWYLLAQALRFCEIHRYNWFHALNRKERQKKTGRNKKGKRFPFTNFFEFLCNFTSATSTKKLLNMINRSILQFPSTIRTMTPRSASFD